MNLSVPEKATRLERAGRRLPWLSVVAAAACAISFGLLVHRHWFLGDDAFIVFRFAKNFVEGHGLVYNVGERVEGYTEPLWVLLVSAAMALGIQPETAAPWLGVFAGIGLLVVVVRFGVALRGPRDPWVWLPPLLLCVNRSFTGWSTGGLGTQLFNFLLLFATTRYLLETGGGRPPRALGSGLLFALATLARPEGGLFLALAGLFSLADFLRGRIRFSDLVRWALPPVVLVGGHLLWRHAYYGFWLPNTFYVKASGWWWEQARHYFRLFIEDHALYLSLPLLLFLFAQPIGRVEGIFLAQIGAWCVYLVYVGGDRFEFRFFTPILPQLFWLLTESCARLSRLWRESGRKSAPFVAPAVLLVLLTSALPELRPPPLQPRENIAPLEAIKGYAEGRAQQGKFLRELVEKGYLDGDELLAVRGAGALPYYSGFPILDIHGLNDVWIAHQPVKERGMIAHEKEPTLEYIRRRRVVMCNVHNTLVFPEYPEHLVRPGVDYADWFPQPVRIVEAEGKYLAFGTTLDEKTFLYEFRRFRILR